MSDRETTKLGLLAIAMVFTAVNALHEDDPFYGYWAGGVALLMGAILAWQVLKAYRAHRAGGPADETGMTTLDRGVARRMFLWMVGFTLVSACGVVALAFALGRGFPVWPLIAIALALPAGFVLWYLGQRWAP